MEPELYALSVQLADTAIRNTAGAVLDKITAAKARKRSEETIAVLEEIVGNLIEDKNELVRIAQSYEQELVAQRISQNDIEYITGNLLPILGELAGASETESEGQSEFQRNLKVLESIISVETVNILQLIGFNFRRAIGEPLTQLIAQLVSSSTPGDPGQNQVLQQMSLQRELAYIEIAKDPESFDRLKKITGME